MRNDQNATDVISTAILNEFQLEEIMTLSQFQNSLLKVLVDSQINVGGLESLTPSRMKRIREVLEQLWSPTFDKNSRS